MDAALSDPWAVIPPAPRRTDLARAVAAAALGASGVLLRLWQLGVNARRAALVLAVAAVLWEVVLRRWAAGRRTAPLEMAAVAVAAVLASAPSGGRAPSLLLLGSVAVADAALLQWSPTRSWPPRTAPVAGLAVPLVAAAQVVWFRTGAAAVFVGLLAAAMAVVVAYHRAPDRVGPADRGLRRAVLGLADVVAAAALAVVAVPVLYLGGAMGRALGLGPSGRRRRAGPTTWRAAGAPPAAESRLPFTSPPPAVRRRRHLWALAVVAVAVLAVGGSVRLVAERRAAQLAASAPTTQPATPRPPVPSPPTTAPATLDLLDTVPYSARPAYDGVPWADDLQRDLTSLRLVPRPGVGYVTADADTPLVKVRDGSRRTVAPVCDRCPRATVWLVGASGAFGVGQRDVGTVASALARRAAADGVALDVRNLGVVGWTSSQEVTDALDRLADGPAPDLVVVLDGFNDVTAAVAREVVGRGGDTGPLVFDEGEVQEALARSAPLGAPAVASSTARAAAAIGAEHDRLRAELARRGVPVRFFFQPDAFASPAQLAAVRDLYEVLPGLLERDELGEVLAGTVARLGDDVVDLRDLYDDLDRPVMLDVVHTNETGARLVADAVYDELGGLVRDRAR